MAVSLVLATAALLALAAPANAAKGWTFLENFGSTNQPDLSEAADMTIDRSTGDLLLFDRASRTLTRWHSDGTPSPFTALGTNVIDGAGGPDATPDGEIVNASNNDVAVDNSGTATDGNIYLTSSRTTSFGETTRFVDIFSSNGGFLGRLTACDSQPTFDRSFAVTVDEDGNVYVMTGLGLNVNLTSEGIYKFEPTGNSPANGDCVDTYPAEGAFVGSLAPGAGPAAGYLFASLNGHVRKIDTTTGNLEYEFDEGLGLALNVTVDPVTGHLFGKEGEEVIEFDASGTTKESVTVISRLEEAAGGVTALAPFDAGEKLYVARFGNQKIEIWEAVAAPEVEIGPPSFVSGTKATLTGTVKPEGGTLSECFFQYGPGFGNTAPCEPEAAAIPADFGSHEVTAPLSGLLANGTTYQYRLVVKGTAKVVSKAKSFTTKDTYFTDPATAVSGTEAMLNGTVRPEGVPLTDCNFEYGKLFLSSSIPCDPEAASIPNIDADVAVDAALSGLKPSTTYRFRLVAENAAGKIVGEEQTFTTKGKPVVEQQAINVTQTAATLHARINPAGAATSYHFEWGPTTSYGNRIPADHELFAGSGTQPVIAEASVSGLQPLSTYYFRVIATNSSGTTVGPDQPFETLNSAGLPNSRGIELVSPADKGVQGSVRSQIFDIVQVAGDGQSALYPLLGGLSDTNAGGDTAYLAKRSPSGWQSTQVSPPSLVPNPNSGLIGVASAGTPVYYSPDLSCGVVRTFNPLTEDTPQAAIELGYLNLYVRHDDGSHTLITNRIPANPEIPTLSPTKGTEVPNTFVVGASEDCSKVYFESEYKFLPGAELYEWDNGVLRDAGRLPNGAAGNPVSLLFSSGDLKLIARLNSVSRDGSRLVFKALSNEPATAGKPAVFVRKDEGSSVVEASRKQGGSTDSLGAQYETASPDGSHVFFLATYGLTPDSSSGPAQGCGVIEPDDPDFSACDLYDYDVDSGELTNLSATTAPANTKGAVARGVLGVSEDGESVYFAAVGQLVVDKGKTYAENVAANSVSLYLARDGELSFAGTMRRAELGRAALQGGVGGGSHVTPDGEHLLFESKENVTGYESGVGEAYLYSAAEDKTICISCRPDGQPSVGWPTLADRSLSGVSTVVNPLRAISDDGSRAYFTKPDVLASGAVSQNVNIYQWEDGQVTLLHTGPPGGSGLGGGESSVRFYSTSASGDDVFIRTPVQLTPHDKDLVLDLYDFRVGGGFAPPPTPPVPCSPAADECQGTPTSQPAAPSPASAGFAGLGNPPEGKSGSKACPKRKVRRRGKCVKRRSRGAKQNKRQRNRAANSNRGGAK